MLFATPFAIVGVIVSVIAFNKISQLIKLQEWEVVPGRVETVELQVTSGETDTYSVQARYRYNYDGKEHVSSQVSPYLSDNIGDFHKSTYERLKKHRDDQSPVDVYVNPDAPEDSMLVREFRWAMLLFLLAFALVFNIVGFGLLAWGVKVGKDARALATLKARYPRQPWLHRADWVAGNITSDSKATALMIGVIALFWNAISTPICFMLAPELRDGNYAVLLFALFPLVGVGLMWTAVVFLLRWRRFGRARLELRTIPTIPGQELRGTLYTGAVVQGARHLEVSVVCQEHERYRSSDGTNVKTVDKWKSTQELPLQPSMGQQREARVDIRFAIPDDAPETSTVPGVGVYYQWVVQAKAEIPGADFSAVFEIPVYRSS